MPFDAPFQLGPFHVGPDGRLALASPERLPRFTIMWRGCRIEARLGVGTGEADLRDESRGDGDRAELSLQALVGRVPSTARVAGQASSQRDAVFAALRSLPATLPDGWRTDLLADHRVTMLTATKVEMPTTITNLLTDVTQFLLALGPYLDLLEELGVEPPAAGREAAPGMVNTCPG